jgi:pimeloyl-ACP methyl ester carboxylesterase
VRSLAGPLRYLSTVNGTRAYFELGQGPLLLCLHGFPDTPFTFQHLMKDLADQGYRVVAPFLSGYRPSMMPENRRITSLINMAEDTFALVDALGEERCFILGHDWGSIAASAAANHRPERVVAIVNAAVPHPRLMMTGLFYPPQTRRSWYIFYFQLQRATEAVTRNDFALIERLYNQWSPGWKAPDYHMEAVRECFRQSGSIDAALGYYRALIRPDQRSLKLAIAPIRVPSLAIAGENDGCIGLSAFRGHGKYVHADSACMAIPSAGHFMHCEQPGAFLNLVQSWLHKHYPA